MKKHILYESDQLKADAVTSTITNTTVTVTIAAATTTTYLPTSLSLSLKFTTHLCKALNIELYTGLVGWLLVPSGSLCHLKAEQMCQISLTNSIKKVRRKHHQTRESLTTTTTMKLFARDDNPLGQGTSFIGAKCFT